METTVYKDKVIMQKHSRVDKLVKYLFYVIMYFNWQLGERTVEGDTIGDKFQIHVYKNIYTLYTASLAENSKLD